VGDDIWIELHSVGYVNNPEESIDISLHPRVSSVVLDRRQMRIWTKSESLESVESSR
jgi:hypothetical protein